MNGGTLSRSISLKVTLMLSTVLCFGIPNLSEATIEELLYNEIVFLRGIELGAGGRALALGGAYRGLSDDLSALYWNPAGLASVRRIEVGLGLAQGISRDEAKISSDVVTNQLMRTRLNEVGIVFPFPTYRGSLVLALGYHQVHSFDTFGTFSQAGGDSSFQGDELESGRLGIWSAGMAVDLSEAVSAGLALRLWSGYDDYSWNSTASYGNLTWTTVDQAINLDLLGFNAIMGILLRTTPWLRIGATLESPLKLSVDEHYSYSEEQSIEGVYEPIPPFSANYEYGAWRSWRGAIGTEATFGPVGLSADAVLNDWSQTSFSGDPPFEDLSREQANREAARNLHPTVDLHVGLEVWIPSSTVRLQAGYAWLPSPFGNNDVISDKSVFTGGISTLLDQSLLVQGALSWTSWEKSIGGWGEDLQLTHLLVNLSYRF